MAENEPTSDTGTIYVYITEDEQEDFESKKARTSTTHY